MSYRLRTLALTAALTGAVLSTPVEGQEADPADVASIDAIIAAVYDVISGDPGEERDWDRWQTLFAEGAMLSPTGPTADGGWQRNMIPAADYPELVGPALAQGFVEAEIGRTTERYGNIAHSFSTYVSFQTRADTEPFQRGINSFQLMWDGSRWWVISVFWQAESADYPIPERYIGEIG